MMESLRPSYSPPFTRKKRRESLLVTGSPSLYLGLPLNTRKRARKENLDLHSLAEYDESSSLSDDNQGSCHISEPPIILSEILVNEKTMELFERAGFVPCLEEVISVKKLQPSIAASVFSSFALLRRKTKESLTSILPLLKCLVDIEIKFMGKREETIRTVRFACIDGSCILPPVDRDPDSLLPQQGAIDALQHAMESVLALSFAATPILRDLAEFLDSNETADLVSFGIVDCSLPQFRSHVSAYRDDFLIIINRLSTLSNEAITPVKQAALRRVEQPLKSVEVLLAKRIGSAIRYHLRMLFNKVPPTISSKTTQPKLERYSNVCGLVAFKGYADSSNVIISSLISRCLRVLCDSFGIASLLGQESVTLPSSFCTSPSSDLKIPKKNETCCVFSTEDFEIVEEEIVHSLEFIENARACKFLVDLWDQPGVKEELDRVGGLDLVETYASMSWNYDLYSICPEDAHLVALCNINELLERLRNLSMTMEPLVEVALDGAQKVARNFRFTTKSRKILGSYPLIKRLKQVYDETMKTLEEIPIIVKK